MKISYVNLGTRVVDGEVKANLPKNDAASRIVDLETIWRSQTKMNPDSEKGMDGMVFPLAVDKLYSIDYMKENAIEGNGLIFLDIDITDLSIRDKIFDEMENINAMMRGYILCAAKSRKGLHVICYGVPMVAGVYKEVACDALALFAKTVNDLYGIDLRKYEGALDTHNCCMKQRFFLHYSPEVYWFEYGTPITFKYPIKQREKLASEYPDIYKVISHRPKHKGYAVQKRGCVLELGTVDKVEYIEHSQRWSLFDSICLCSNDEEDAMEGWKLCVEKMPYEKHSKSFFMEEPNKNHWYQRLQDRIEANEDTMINHKLMRMFGFEVIDETRKVIMFNKNLKNNRI